MIKYTPGFPVPVVRVIVPNEQGKVLILKRAADTAAGGAWCLPGGKVDHGDTVTGAARRELAEETGLACGGMRFLFYQDSLPASPHEVHYLNMYLTAETSGRVELNHESCDFAWVGREELGLFELAFQNGEGLLRYWGGKI